MRGKPTKGVDKSPSILPPTTATKTSVGVSATNTPFRSPIPTIDLSANTVQQLNLHWEEVMSTARKDESDTRTPKGLSLVGLISETPASFRGNKGKRLSFAAALPQEPPVQSPRTSSNDTASSFAPPLAETTVDQSGSVEVALQSFALASPFQCSHPMETIVEEQSGSVEVELVDLNETRESTASSETPMPTPDDISEAPIVDIAVDIQAHAEPYGDDDDDDDWGSVTASSFAQKTPTLPVLFDPETRAPKTPHLRSTQPTDQWTPPGEMIMAQNLDFEQRADGNENKRPSRFGEGAFYLIEQKRADERMRWVILLVAVRWGHLRKDVTRKQKRQIELAASRLVAYDWGFKRPLNGWSVEEWNRGLEASLKTGEVRLSRALQPNPVGNQNGSFVDRLDKEYPKYLTSLFREAQKAEGNRATWKEHAEAINLLSENACDARPAMDITEGQLCHWFKSREGKCTKSVTRPVLTAKHMEARVTWCTAMKRANDAHCLRHNGSTSIRDFKAGPPHRCFEDEKWFYTSSGRRKVKQLPCQPGETAGAADYRPDRVSSRRFATKVMFAGVVACPQPEHGFNGKIYMKRVSERVQAQKNTFYPMIVDDWQANKVLQSSWRSLHLPEIIPDMTAGELLDSFLAVDEYCLDEETREHLVLRFNTFTASLTAKQKTKWVAIEEHQTVLGQKIRRSRGGPLEPINIKDVHLQKVRRNGDWHDKDTTCDSEWMKVHMIEMGEAIRKSHWWLPLSQEIELIMDNAGGHGTKDAIDWCEKEVLKRFNVRIIHQIPRSPETNLLDLGIWCGLQAFVEKVHRWKTKSSADALARTVMNAWDQCNSFTSFRNVCIRWDKVLSLILAGDGDNHLVDKQRKQLIVPIVMAPMPQSELDDLVEDDWCGHQERETQLAAEEEIEEAFETGDSQFKTMASR